MVTRDVTIVDVRSTGLLTYKYGGLRGFILGVVEAPEQVGGDI